MMRLKHYQVTAVRTIRFRRRSKANRYAKPLEIETTLCLPVIAYDDAQAEAEFYAAIDSQPMAFGGWMIDVTEISRKKFHAMTKADE